MWPGLFGTLSRAIQLYKSNCPPSYAGCLGRLGARDPATLQLDPEAGAYLEPSVFGCHLTQNLLVPLLLNRKTHNQAAFAIQTLTQDPKLWQRLETSVQKMVEPFRSSHFQLAKEYEAAVDEGNVFQLQPDLGFSAWLAGITQELIKQANGPNKLVYLACAPVTHKTLGDRTLHLTNFMLPYLCLDVLRDESEDKRRWLLSGLSSVFLPDSSIPDTVRIPCLKKVFQVLDWLRSTDVRLRGLLDDPAYFPHFDLARGARLIGDFSRALLHYEQVLLSLTLQHLRLAHRSLPPLAGDMISELQAIFTGLEDADSLRGLGALSQVGRVPELGDFITEASARREMSEGLSLYLHSTKDYDPNLWQHLKSFGVPVLLEWYMEHCKRQNLVENSEIELQACWRLGMWDRLQELIPETSDHLEFDTKLGILLSLVQQKSPIVPSALDSLRADLINGLSLSQHSQEETYSWFLKFHIVEDIASLGLAEHDLPKNLDLPLLWTSRLKALRPGLKHVELLLSVHRSLGLARPEFQSAISRSWLAQAEAARLEGNGQVAFNCLANLLGSNTSPEVALEYGRVLVLRGQAQLALTHLTKSLDVPLYGKLSSQTKTVTIPHIHLLIAKLKSDLGYSEEVVASSFQACIERATAEKTFSWCGKVHMQLAKFYDRLLVESQASRKVNIEMAGNQLRYQEQDRQSTRSALLKNSFEQYTLACLKRPTTTIFALPRLLTFWFDRRGDGLYPDNVATNIDLSAIFQRFVAALPSHYWFPVFAQLCARVGLLEGVVLSVVEDILLRALVEHTHAASWLLYFYYQTKRTSNSGKKKVGVPKVWDDAKGRPADKFATTDTVDKSTRLAILNSLPELIDGFRELALPGPGKQHEKERTITASNFPKIHKLLRQNTHCCVPYQSQLYYVEKHHKVVTIVGIHSSLEVQGSIRAPKKIILIGSDGNEYTVFPKSGDDLRKDGRIQDFFRLVNFLLKKDPESRQRHLRIQTYSATPMTDLPGELETGVIECVPNSVGFRFLVETCYPKAGKPNFFHAGQVELLYGEPLPQDRSTTKFREPWKTDHVGRYKDILKRFGPPRWHTWFLNAFPEPSRWYQARRTYVNSVAVTSILGAVMGIGKPLLIVAGDRHCENILVNVKTGEVVHIDFNVVFWKGLGLRVPERVPFRLTPNIIDGFGVTGTAGGFQHVAELTVSLLRKHHQTLLTIVETFVYDPFSDIPKSSEEKKKKTTSPAENPEAERLLQRVQNYIEGALEGSPLSVENHVKKFIEQATNPDNLSQIFRGWLPWV